MGRIERVIEVKSSIEKVWSFLTDLRKYPSFMTGVKKVEYLTEGRGLGAKTHWVMESGGQEMEWDAEVTEWIENKKIGWRSTSGMKTSGFWVIEPTTKGAKLTFITDYELPYSILGKIVDKLKVEKNSPEGWMKAWKGRRRFSRAKYSTKLEHHSSL